MKRVKYAVAVLILLQLPAPSVAQRRRSGAGYPGSGSGTSLPRAAPADVLPSFSGTVRGIGGKVLTLERPDSNTIEFHCSGKTRYYDGAKKVKANAIAPGDQISVEAKRAPDGSLDAVNVRLEHRKPS